jgi:hypothetical protein
MPRMLILTLACLGFGWCSATAAAQSSETYADSSTTDLFPELPNDSTVTPEMWFYLQEYRRYHSPREAVRRKAEFRSAQRQARLAAQRWFGFTNLRPTVNPVPYYGSYSPSWTGSPRDPFAWMGHGTPRVMYHTARRGE